MESVCLSTDLDSFVVCVSYHATSARSFSSAASSAAPGSDGNEADFLNSYTLEEILGTGAFATVHRSHHHGSRRQCACKVMRKDITLRDGVARLPLDKESLSNELRILKDIGGKKNIIQLVAHYEDKKSVYIVMELCAGGDLFTYLGNSSDGAITYSDLAKIGYQLLIAVHHCHSHRVMHRDIKPENIMFKHSMDGSPLKLVDFGCGCYMEEETTRALKMGTKLSGTSHSPEFSTVFAGTPFYVAPEVFDRLYSYPADVWSIGVIMLVIMAGYPSSDVEEAFTMIQRADRDLRGFPGMAESLPNQYFDFVSKLLNVDAAGRAKCEDMLSHPFMDAFVANDQSASLGLPSPHQHDAEHDLSLRVQDELDISLSRHNTFHAFRKFLTKASFLIASELKEEGLQELIKELNKVAVELQGGGEVNLNICKVGDLLKCLERKGHKDLVDVLGPEGAIFAGFDFEIKTLKKLNRSHILVKSSSFPRSRLSVSAHGAPRRPMTKIPHSHSTIWDSSIGRKGSMDSSQSSSVKFGKRSRSAMGGRPMPSKEDDLDF